jgi:ketosteroid isomerase-like protein
MSRSCIARRFGGLMAMTAILSLAACESHPPANPPAAPPASNAQLQEQVMGTERAFAATMAQRDRKAFAGFLDTETIFFSSGTVLRGREQVDGAWSPYFDGSDAPFSWEPDAVQVLDSGTLALSTGPVRDPSGNVIARFNSIWRRNPAGDWKIIFDKGSPP